MGRWEKEVKKKNIINQAFFKKRICDTWCQCAVWCDVTKNSYIRNQKGLYYTSKWMVELGTFLIARWCFSISKHLSGCPHIKRISSVSRHPARHLGTFYTLALVLLLYSTMMEALTYHQSNIIQYPTRRILPPFLFISANFSRFRTRRSKIRVVTRNLLQGWWVRHLKESNSWRCSKLTAV